MGNVVELHPLRLEENSDFVADCCRYFENLVSEETLRRKYKFSEDVWQRLGEDERLIEVVEAEKLRRIRNEAPNVERAQQHVVRAPDPENDPLNLALAEYEKAEKLYR